MTRNAERGSSVRSAAVPGSDSPATVKGIGLYVEAPNVSSARTAYPSMVARRNAGTSTSLITSPAYPQKLTEGWWTITGIAWSGRGKIVRVDISTDGGESWQPVGDLDHVSVNTFALDPAGAVLAATSGFQLQAPEPRLLVGRVWRPVGTGGAFEPANGFTVNAYSSAPKSSTELTAILQATANTSAEGVFRFLVPR